MNELLEIFDDAQQRVGLVARNVVHKLGMWHRTANIFLFRSDGRLVVQRRHKSKDVWPDAWDLSVAEHLRPGEEYLAGAERGLLEELGVENIHLEPITGVIRSSLVIVELGINDILSPVFFGQVIKRAHADDTTTTTDYNYSSLCFHYLTS